MLTLRVRGRAGFALSDHMDGVDSAEVVIGVVFKFVEDDRAGRVNIPLEFPSVPNGFIAADSDGHFRGRLGHDRVFLDFESEAYAADWTARVIALGDLVEQNTDAPQEVAADGQ